MTQLPDILLLRHLNWCGDAGAPCKLKVSSGRLFNGEHFSNSLWCATLRDLHKRGLATKLRRAPGTHTIYGNQQSLTYYHITPKGLKLLKELGV